MAQLAINTTALVQPAGLSAGIATAPDGLRQLLPGDDCRFLCRTASVNPSAFNEQQRIFAPRHDRRADDATSTAGRPDRSGTATAVIPAGSPHPAGHFMVATGTFCRVEPPLHQGSARGNSRPGQGAAVVVLVSTAAVLQRRQHCARANTGRIHFNPVLTETHHG